MVESRRIQQCADRLMASGIRDKVAILGMGCSRFGERWDAGPEDLMQEAFYEATADAGLVGHHDHQPAGPVEGRDGVLGAGDPAEVLPAEDIAMVLVQHPVAVEEQGGAERGFERGFGHGATIAACDVARRFQKGAGAV